MTRAPGCSITAGAAPRKLWERSSGGLLRQSRHAAEACARLRRRGRPAGWQSDLPGGRRFDAGRRPAVPRSARPAGRGQKQRLFQSEDQSYETVVGVITTDAARVVTRRETRGGSAERVHARPEGQRARRAHHLRRSGAVAEGREGRDGDLSAQGRRPAARDDLHAAGLDAGAGQAAGAAVGLPARVHRSADRQPGDRLAVPLHHAGLEHAAPAVPAPGLRRHRRCDDADRRRGRDGQRHATSSSSSRARRPRSTRPRPWASSIRTASSSAATATARS